MATRLSIRPRPLDLSRQLTIVRDVSELDSVEGLEGAEVGAAPLPLPLPLPEDPAHAGPSKPKPKEIPVPEVHQVASYTRDYLPLFDIPATYIRGKGGLGWQKEEYVEYDLDNDDEDWLAEFNKDHNRLSAERFERMLWRLELANAAATERALSASGAATEKATVSSAATIAHMPRSEALSVLRKAVGGRDVLLGQVYEYWATKRRRQGKPMLRRLWAPTSASDPNPFNVFRPREKINRPQTRRRRDNSVECLEKMRTIRENILKALDMTQLLICRECKKRDVHRVDIATQQLQLALHHQPKAQQEAAELEAMARLHELVEHSTQIDVKMKLYTDPPGGVTPSMEEPLRRAALRKRRRQELPDQVNAAAVKRLPPPPRRPELQFLFVQMPCTADGLPAAAAAASPAAVGDSSSANALPNGRHDAGTASTSSNSNSALWRLPPGLDMRALQPRITRGGRVMLARVDPLTWDPLLPPPPNPAGAGGQASTDVVVAGAGEMTSAAALSPQLEMELAVAPWAAGLDISWLPEHIDRGPILQQRIQRQQAALHQAAQQQQQAGRPATAAKQAKAAVAAAPLVPALTLPPVPPAAATPPAATNSPVASPPPQPAASTPPVPATSVLRPPLPPAAASASPTMAAVSPAISPPPLSTAVHQGAAAAAAASLGARKPPKPLTSLPAAGASSRSPSPGAPPLSGQASRPPVVRRRGP